MRLALIAAVLVACGGSAGNAPIPPFPNDAGPFVVPPQITYDTHITAALSGLDCSTQECPHFGNLQCITVVGHRECHFVMRPQDGCETGFAPLGAATWNRLLTTSDGTTVCTKECIALDDQHGTPFWCPYALECVAKIPVAAADGGTELHGGCLH